MIRVKRVYSRPAPEDGLRVLVDRLWPRALPKEQAEVDLWLKEIAPSTQLRHWFGHHDPEQWPEFRRRYFEELRNRDSAVQMLRERARQGIVTLLFATKEQRFNNAVALQEYLESPPPAAEKETKKPARSPRHAVAQRARRPSASRPSREPAAAPAGRPTSSNPNRRPKRAA